MNEPERLELIRELAVVVKRDAQRIGITSIAVNADTIEMLADAPLGFLEINRDSLKPYSDSNQRDDCGRAIEPGEAFGLAFQGNRSESRICPQCGMSYGNGDLCCLGCGHCFICSEHHDLAANLTLDTLRATVVKS